MKKYFKPVFKLFTAACVMFSAVSIYPVDFSFRLTPAVIFPQTKDFKTGFTGFAQADLDLFGFMTAGLEGNFTTVKPDADGFEDTFFYGGGAGLGFYFYPLSRVQIGAGGAFGLYQWTTKIKDTTKSASDLYWRAYGEAGFRFSPSFTLNAAGGYISYMNNGSEPVMNAPFAGLSFKFTVPMGKKGSSDFIISLEQEDSAFPVFVSAYRTCPIGTLILRNNSGAEVKDVHVSFKAGKYTSGSFESAVIKQIRKYGTEEIPLCVDLSDEILKFSENGKLSGEIVVNYKFLGKQMQAVHNVVLSVYNRNAFVWSDSTALSAFVSPDTPEVLEFAKYVAGIARNSFVSGMSRNLQMSAAMYEALRLSGIVYSKDKITPYTEYHKSEQLDKIQYPLQTMNYLSGDYDDIGVLLMSCLESVGVQTGYLVLDDDFIVLVNSGVKAGAELNAFSNADGLVIDDSVYFGLSMADFDKSFAASRKSASKKIAKAVSESGDTLEFTNVHEAWKMYSPAAFSGYGTNFEKAGQASITKALNAAVQDYKDTDLTEVLARARKTGDSNKIGVVLVRLGRYSEAASEFSKLNTVAAMNNLANVYMLQKNYSAAASTYKKVLAKEPENRIALNGLDSANAKLSK